VAGASAYKWSTSDSFSGATDLGNTTSVVQTGLTCGNAYTIYVWSYNGCGNSTSTPLTQSTLNCWTCGSPIFVEHVAGTVAPVNKSTSYGTVTNVPGETSKCWITSNLGADRQAYTKNEATEPPAGWYWQFNKMQGYKHDGSVRTPNTTWITSIDEYSNWLTSNDPCINLLGGGWRMPTYFELYNVDFSGGWNNIDDAWNSLLKMHMAGRLQSSTGALGNRGVDGSFWTNAQGNTTSGHRLQIYSSYSSMNTFGKAFALTIRCIKD
jgi:hypothetical protein